MTDLSEAFDTFFGGTWRCACDASHGQGAFGRWVRSEAGEWAYAYEMDQVRNPRAAYYTTLGASRDHWHLIGNDRIGATAHNGGYVELYDWTRGGKIINRLDPENRNYAGGFKFVDVDGRVFNTLWEHLPAGGRASSRATVGEDADPPTQDRTFGMGHFTKVTCYQGLTITERIEAPQGDDPVLLSVTTLRNSRGEASELSIVEYWGVNLYQLFPAPIMRGGLGRFFRWYRGRLNRRFVMKASWDEAAAALAVRFVSARSRRIPKPEEPSLVDYHPKAVFLAALDPLPEGFTGFAVDADRFFDKNGIENPPGVQGAADSGLFERRSAHNGGALLALRRTVSLGAGQEITWRYLFGYGDEQYVAGWVEQYRRPVPSGPRPVLELVTPEAPWLNRELLWHSYYLQAGTYYQEFFGEHLVDQGSAYSYLHGVSGAHRDFALFTLPMVYLRPELAKEMLRFSMRSQQARTGALPYLHMGHGKVSGALVHARSTDLDLFLLWALSEYLAATRDLHFLEEVVPFYPPSARQSGAVLEHAHAAFRHLTESVGVGPHGLLRFGTGDWNDQTLAFSRFAPLTIHRGESAFNAGLATVALPALAGAIEVRDAPFAAALREFADGQARALQPLWVGDHAARGYLGYGKAVLGRGRVFLDAQAFGVLGGVWDDEQIRRLFERVQSDCVDPQPAGARCLWPAMKGLFAPEGGSDTNGGTWAAIDSWTVWAWSMHDPKRAWDFYLKTTLAAHAEAYPDIWYGVWSGPDAYNAHYHPRPGETFVILPTPMTDFPVMNMNRHAGPLLDAIRLAGIEPRDGLITINPRLPFDSFAIRLPLLGAAYLPDRHRGYYLPVAAGPFRFAVRCPANLDPGRVHLTVGGAEAPYDVAPDRLVRFECTGIPGTRIAWEMT